jgi:transcriptional regulator with XRE-family HTH domain
LPFYNIELKALKPLPDRCLADFPSLGELIRVARIEKGLLQTEVAELFEVSVCTIINWENMNSLPRQQYIPRIIPFISDLKESSTILNIGKTLKSHRDYEGLTQNQMAKKLDISTSTYRRIEMGKLSMKAVTLDKVVRYLSEY